MADAPAAGAAPSIREHWAVTVERNGEQVVCIESHHLSGRDLSPEDEQAIETAARHLLAFIGRHELEAALTAAPGEAEARQVWQSIETAPKDERVFFWVVPKTAEESYVDTSGRPITVDHKGYRHEGKWGTWGALSKPTHWMPLPDPPARSASAPPGEETP